VNLTELWSKILPGRKKPQRHFYSLVLLLRAPKQYTQQDLELAGETAWGQPFNTSEDSPFIVHQDSGTTLIKCQSFLINLLQAKTPYSPPDRERSLAKTDERGRSAWEQHTAWMAFDLLNDYDFTPETGFAALARWAQPFLGPNCTAAFIPSIGRTLINNGAADRGLKSLIALDQKASPES
jgi:hypothetical protein